MLLKKNQRRLRSNKKKSEIEQEKIKPNFLKKLK